MRAGDPKRWKLLGLILSQEVKARTPIHFYALSPSRNCRPSRGAAEGSRLRNDPDSLTRLHAVIGAPFPGTSEPQLPVQAPPKRPPSDFFTEDNKL